MAGESLFKQLEFEAFRAGITPRTKQSIEWFRNKARQMFRGRVITNREKIMDDELLSRTGRVDKDPMGNMYMFFYDPKHKKTLPYYDGFPLIIMLGPAPNGFYGLNLHYLPMNLRAKLLDGLLDNLSNKKYDETTRFRLNYGLLQRTSKLRYFKPCFKHYLNEYVKSKIAKVPSPEWEIATFLPTASFKKSNTSNVYKVSRSMI